MNWSIFTFCRRELVLRLLRENVGGYFKGRRRTSTA